MISPYLTGKCLVAMPGLAEAEFERSVVYVCSHTDQGAMGVVVNRHVDGVMFSELLDQLEISSFYHDESKITYGGPVDPHRGFVLHSLDYLHDSSIVVNDNLALTGSVDVLRQIAIDEGPRKNIVLLGYAGWDAGQLEEELKENSWLVVDPSDDLIFCGDYDHKWEMAIETLGIDAHMLSAQAGVA
ncbi:MAG: YqgE/AlgH family protein [Alphaproteobacteria bacterium]|nr:YqgE/AlgH family protein [Alphaproteobacteria bacterium]